MLYGIKRGYMKIFTFVLLVGFLASCGNPNWDPFAASEFSAARANEVHSIGQKIRDKCNETKSLETCRDWLDYQHDIEEEWKISSYLYYLEQWEKKGPY